MNFMGVLDDALSKRSMTLSAKLKTELHNVDLVSASSIYVPATE